MAVPERRYQPTWATVVAAVCLVAVAFLWWNIGKLTDRLETEQVYRASSREREMRLLTLIEHTSCEDIEELRGAVAEMRLQMERENARSD